MVKITFKGKLRNIGTATVVGVPAQYIKDGMLWTGEEFEVTINTLEPIGEMR